MQYVHWEAVQEELKGIAGSLCRAYRKRFGGKHAPKIHETADIAYELSEEFMLRSRQTPVHSPAAGDSVVKNTFLCQQPPEGDAFLRSASTGRLDDRDVLGL